MMKYLPTDVSSFERLISGSYIYVDKTEYIYNLFSAGAQYYFLSRPRRFGKTLLVSTLKELFSGNRQFFKGLWIDNSDWKWEKHPVIHLDFGTIAHISTDELRISLMYEISSIAKKYNIDVSLAPTASAKLKLLIEILAETNKVVVLIDEYDKPILDHLKNIEEAKAQRDTLKSLYDTLKGLDDYLRAIFITGVTKFAKTSLFSGLNNLNDLTIKPEAAALLGYTQEELNAYFANYVSVLADHNKSTPEIILGDMKTWYNGYQFSEESIKVYNPFSVLYCLKDRKFKNYWYESGTPTFLVNLLRSQYQGLEEIKDVEIGADNLGSFDIENIPLVPLLFQTGYLTLAHYNEATKKYKLSYPNFEIEESFKKFLISSLAHVTSIMVDTSLTKLINALKAQDLASFCKILQTLFAQIPYTLHIEQESYYHSLFQFLMSLLALEAHSEVITNRGIVDTVMSIDNILYIFELKLNKKATHALKQIRDKKYYEPYLLTHSKIILVGLSFKAKENERLNVEYTAQELSGG
jgi:hypothetical protein